MYGQVIQWNFIGKFVIMVYIVTMIRVGIKLVRLAKMWDFYGGIVLAIILIFIFQNKTGITDIRMFELLVNTVIND